MRLRHVFASNFARRERQGLAEALRASGPDAPTLCEGWTTKDLVVHLVLREARPDAAVGMFVPAVSGHLDSVTAKYSALPYEELVQRFEAGPPWWSPMKPLDKVVNVTENFIHFEDVRRARGGEVPARPLDDQDRELLWFFIDGRASLLVKKSDVPIELRWKDRSVRCGAASHGKDETLTIEGDPQDLLLWLFGRDAAVSQLTISDPGLFQRVSGRSV
ncbi:MULTISPECIES: TIGR03085 family metal-binding protein [Corynebacterium]|uniref:TIGR03085 family metal-binding protein n=1 Tax=Corynebacterium TaxID=1716 RepID=UPI001E4354E5|nr:MULTISPECIES: TIGR03085 family metal-binding protein [Corynebacterium]